MSTPQSLPCPLCGRPMLGPYHHMPDEQTVVCERAADPTVWRQLVQYDGYKPRYVLAVPPALEVRIPRPGLRHGVLTSHLSQETAAAVLVMDRRDFDCIMPTLNSQKCQLGPSDCRNFAVYCDYRHLACEEHVPRAPGGGVHDDWWMLPLRYEGPT